MNQLIFRCDITGCYIEYILEGTVAHMNSMDIDYENMKAFFGVLRRSVDSLKQSNIEEISQVVLLEDWDSFLNEKTSFRLTKTDPLTKTCEVVCCIDDFLENFGKGVGL